MFENRVIFWEGHFLEPIKDLGAISPELIGDYIRQGILLGALHNHLYQIVLIHAKSPNQLRELLDGRAEAQNLRVVLEDLVDVVDDVLFREVFVVTLEDVTWVQLATPFFGKFRMRTQKEFLGTGRRAPVERHCPGRNRTAYLEFAACVNC